MDTQLSQKILIVTTTGQIKQLILCYYLPINQIINYLIVVIIN